MYSRKLIDPTEGIAVSSDDPFAYTVKLKRGDGHDVQKCKVTAPDVETLEERVEEVRERMEKWASDYRNIQPREGRDLHDDQAGLNEVAES
jgi:hypothetical protein